MSSHSEHRHVGSPLRAARLWRRPQMGRTLGYTTAANEALRTAGLVVMALLGPAVFYPLLGQGGLHALGPRVGLALLVCMYISAAMVMLLRTWSVPLLLVLYGLVPLATWLMAPARGMIVPSDLWAPGMFIMPLVALTMLTLPRRAYWRWLVYLLGVMTAIELWVLFGSHPWVTTRFLLLDSIFLLQAPLAYIFSADGLVAMGQHRDALAERAREAERAQLAHTADSEGRREAARLLHDHVLHALHAVGRERSLVSSQQAIDECRSAVDQLFRPRASEPVASLREVLGRDRLVGEVVHHLDGDADPLPAAVAETLAAAVHEALSNVRRHARATRCTVTIAPFLGQGVWVTISDNGRGFDPARGSSTSFGMRSSVVERLDDLGGHAKVASAPGMGTQVDLHWPATATRGADQARELAANQQVTRVMSRSAVPTWVVTVVMGLLIVPLLHPVWLGSLLCLAILAAGGWSIHRLQDHAMGSVWANLMMALAITAWGANLLMVPIDQGQLYLLWTWWGGGMLAHLVMVARSTVHGLRAAVTMMLVMALGPLVRFGPSFMWVHFTNTVLMGSAPPMIAFAVTLVTRRMSSHASHQAQLRSTTRAATARMHHLARMDHYWSEQVNEETLPLLRGVANGELDPADPVVQRQAANLEMSVREELVLGPERGELAALLQGLRSAGWRVHSTLSRDDAPTALDAATTLVALVGAPAFKGQLLMASASTVVANAVIFDATPTQLEDWRLALEQAGGRMDHDPEFTRLGLEVR